MRYIYLLILISIVPVNADTYIYHLDTKKNSAQTIKSSLSDAEIKNSGQPYLNTSIVSYRQGEKLISFTPKDGEDFKLDEKASGVELYKIIRLNEDGFFETIVDNSELFDFEVVESSN